MLPAELFRPMLKTHSKPHSNMLGESEKREITTFIIVNMAMVVMVLRNVLDVNVVVAVYGLLFWVIRNRRRRCRLLNSCVMVMIRLVRLKVRLMVFIVLVLVRLI